MFVALGNQHAMRMRRIISSSVAYLALPFFFPHYLINDTIFKNKDTEHKMCFEFLYNFYRTHIPF